MAPKRKKPSTQSEHVIIANKKKEKHNIQKELKFF
jgi:hypothetical protein